MISQAPSLRIKTHAPIGNDLFFTLPDLSDNNASFLEADVAVGASSMTANGMFFTAGQYIVVGQPQFEKTEIVKIQSVTNTTIALTTGLIFSHNRGDVITFIEYNQLTPERSTDGGTNFSALSAIDINPQVAETYLQRTGDATTDVYRFRFYNATSLLYSGYSSSATASGYADNSVYAIKKRALSQLGEKLSDLITDDFLNDALNEGRRVVDMGTATVDGVSQRVLRWSFRTKFNTDIGNAIPGAWSVTAPTDLRDRNTFKNILGLRIGRSNWPLTYQPRHQFNQNYLNVAHTTIKTVATADDATVTLTSSGDFQNPSGTVVIGAETVLLHLDSERYTANDIVNGIITLSSPLAFNHAVGTNVWQQATFGMPTAYTIDNGTLYFDTPFSNTEAGYNIYMDYYQTLTAVAIDSDLLDEPFYDLYVPYLKYKIKALKSNGSLDLTTDSDYKLFQQGLSELVSQEVSGQVVSFVPDSWGNLNGSAGLGRAY